MNSAIKSKIKFALKITAVLALFFFLGKKGFISVNQTRHAILEWRYSVPGFLGLVFCSFLGVIRWNWLMKAHGIHLPISRTLQLTFIGNFFNIALPGAVSGDFIKAFYVGKEANGQNAKAFGSILFDRVAGLSALVVLSAVAFLVEIASMTDSAFLKAVQVFLSTAAVAVILFYAYLFLVRENHDPLLRLFKFLESKSSKLGLFARIYESLRHYHSHRVTVLKVLGISVIVHLIVGWSFLQFAYALGDTQLQLLPLYVIVPLGLLVIAVPVLPAGLGTGHAAFLYLFGLLGSQRGADVFSIYALATIILGAVGGAVYLRFRSTEAAPVLAQI
jgi:uncharacterized protein (TIRG00374 family)